MRPLSAVTITLLSSLLPAAALACDGGYEVLGSASFTPAGEVTALAATSESGFDWLLIGKDERSERGRLNAPPAEDGFGPRIRATDKTLFALIDGTLHEVGGRALEPALEGVDSFDVARGGSLLLAATYYDEEGAPQLTLFDEGLDGLRELGRTSAACETDKVAVGRFADGAIAGLCGDTPFRLDGDVLSLEPPLGLGTVQAVESAGVDADGSVVFFAVVNAFGETGRSNILSLRRTATGAWTSEVIALVPIGLSGEGRLAAASPDAVAVAGVDDSGTLTLYAILRDAGSDRVEIVATISASDRLSASGNASSMKILAGGYRLSLFERASDDIWTETSLGKIGKRTKTAGCSVTGISGRPSGSLAFLALAAFFARVVRRRNLTACSTPG